MNKKVLTTVHPQGTEKADFETKEHEMNSLVNAALAGPFNDVLSVSSQQEYKTVGGANEKIDNGPNTSANQLRVGNGAAPVSYDDNSLETLLDSANLSGASHGLDDTAEVARFVFSGTVPNNSGGSWSVTEVGMTWNMDNSSGGTSQFLVARDIISSQSVADGQQISVDFEFEVP